MRPRNTLRSQGPPSPRGQQPGAPPEVAPIDGWPLSNPRTVWLLSVIWPKLARIGRTSRGKRITAIVFALVAIMIAIGIYGVSRWFLGIAYRVEVIGPLLCQRLLDMLLLVLLSVLLLSNVVSALTSFFMAKDLDILMAAPLPPRSLFGARFGEQILHSSWMVLGFGLPVLLAFAKVAGTPWTYPALLLALPPLLLIPAAAANIATILIVSAMPAARARDVVIGLLFVGFIALYLIFRLVEPERFLNPEGFASMVSFVASFSAPSGAALPSHWATAVIGATFRDDAGAGRPLLMLAALWTAAGSAYVMAGFVFRKVYVGAYTRSQQGRKVAKLSRFWARLRGKPLPADGEIRSPGRHGADRDLTRIVGGLAPRGPIREFLIKDLKLLVRDASQWSQLVLLLALIVVYLYNFRHFRKLGETGLIGPLGLFILGLGLSAFVTAAVSVRFAYPLISIEGRMMWLLRTAPIPPERIVRAKLMSTLPPLFILAQVMSLASSWILAMPLRMTLLAAGVAALVALTVAAIATGVGALLPDYRAESAAKVAASYGGLVCMSVAILAAFAIVGWAAYPAYLIDRGYALRRIGPLVICIVGALATAGLGIWLPLRLGGRALAKGE